MLSQRYQLFMYARSFEWIIQREKDNFSARQSIHKNLLSTSSSRRKISQSSTSKLKGKLSLNGIFAFIYNSFAPHYICTWVVASDFSYAPIHQIYAESYNRIFSSTKIFFIKIYSNFFYEFNVNVHIILLSFRCMHMPSVTRVACLKS